MAKPQQASGGIKIGPDEEIYAELIGDEKSTEEDIMAEIELQDWRLTYFKDLQLSTKNCAAAWIERESKHEWVSS